MNFNYPDDFIEYHKEMVEIKDCDPAYLGLKYIAERFELNMEQKFWLAFLYACCYCVPTVYYIYNEFPDYENVSIKRLENWWKINKNKCLFQTDRLKVKSFNKFVDIYKSYKKLVGSSQEIFWFSLAQQSNAEENYKVLYKFASQIYYFGRYSLFLYLEAMKELTEINIIPENIDLRNSESTRNGLCYAINRKDLIVYKNKKNNLTSEDYKYLETEYKKLVEKTKEKEPMATVWSVETSLCAYKKMFWKTRYLGYYIDRLMVEIKKMEELVTEGVCWNVLWDFRKETFDKTWLGELSGWVGVRNNLMGIYKKEKIYEQI